MLGVASSFLSLLPHVARSPPRAGSLARSLKGVIARSPVHSIFQI